MRQRADGGLRHKITDMLPDWRPWAALGANWKYVCVLGGFLVFFLLLLLPIPGSGSILGSVDTLFTPAFGRLYINRMQAAISGSFLGRSMYPANISNFGEMFLGEAGAWMLFSALGLNDAYALYLTQVFMLSLMAFSMVLLAEQYTRSFHGAILAGLVFSTSNFLWANVDDLAVHFYFLPLLSAYFLKRAIQNRDGRYLVFAGAMGGIQPYFSGQVYFYQTLILILVVLFSWRAFWDSTSLRQKAASAAAYFLIPLPLVLYYLRAVLSLGAVDLWPASTQGECFYLQLPDMLTNLPGKLIAYPFVHPYITQVAYNPYCWLRQSAFIGLGIPILAIKGLTRLRRGIPELVTIGLIGLLLAFGDTITVGQSVVTSPVYLFDKYFPMSAHLRVGLRSYSLTVMSLSIMAAAGLDGLRRFLKRYNGALTTIALPVCLLFILGENVSWPLNRYEVIPYPAIPDGYVEFFRDKPQALVLDLPSIMASWPGYTDEIRYVLWQTQHKRNDLSGVTGYYPPSRLRTQEFVDLLPSARAFRYFEGIGVTHFVWHNSPHLHSPVPGSFMAIPQISNIGTVEPARDYSWLETSPYLTPVFKNNLITIYALRKPSLASNFPRLQ